MSDLVGNPEDRFSRVAAHMVKCILMAYAIVLKHTLAIMVEEDFKAFLRMHMV